jgi:GNAT superfamily N-acetyltransferase
MCYLGGYDLENMKYPTTFFGYMLDDKIVGVNSGHGCMNHGYRSRGLWVDPNYRNNGIGVSLLTATINQAKLENFNQVWSFPRKTSWSTYKGAGFELTSNWEQSETSDSNAYCSFLIAEVKYNKYLTSKAQPR